MTIKEQFLKNLENQETKKELKRKTYAKQLGEKINAALLDSEFIERATKALIKHGQFNLQISAVSAKTVDVLTKKALQIM